MTQRPRVGSSEGRPRAEQFSDSIGLENAVIALITSADFRAQPALASVSGLAKQYGPGIYVELLWQLAHLHYEPDVAETHWKGITELRERLISKLECPVDLRVALVFYFVEVNRELKNPTVIELKLLEETRAAVYRDELTGLYNFRYLREHLSREVARAQRFEAPLSVVLYDIDDFKVYNDREGHLGGNKALTAIGHIVASSVRRMDIAARYGGEEFILALPATPKDRAMEVAERIRRRIELHFEREPGTRVTVSGGVATYPADGAEAEMILKAADHAMYVAKSRGKNQISIHGDDRRSHRRVETVLEGFFRVLDREDRPLSCIDISDGGMQISALSPLPLGAVLEVQVALPGAPKPFSAIGRVVRIEERDKGHVEVGLVFVNMSDRCRRDLKRFLRATAPA